MLKRIFIDVETTGDGTNLYHDIVEIYCELWVNSKKVSVFEAEYAHSASTVFQMGINKKKAFANKKKKCKTSEEGITDFITWLEEHLDKDEKVFFIAYGCEWDFTHVKNWFKRTRNTKRKYFYTPGLCVMQLMAVKTGKWLNLSKACYNMGISVKKEKLHTAKYDTYLCRLLYFRLENRLKHDERFNDNQLR